MPSAAPASAATTEPTVSPQREFLASLRALLSLGPVFWVCLAVYCLDGAAYFGILNVLTIFLGKDVGLSDRWAGVLVSYMTGLMTLFSFTLGFLPDAWGVRRTITVAAACAVAGRTLLAGAPSLGIPSAVVGLTPPHRDHGAHHQWSS